MKTIKTILVLTIFSILLSSCNNVGMDPIVGIENKYLNKAIKLSIIEDWTSFNRSEIVAIYIMNISNNLITIPFDEGIKIFALEGDEWVEINKQYDEHYQQNQRNVNFLPGDYVPFQFVGDFPDTDEDLLVRVYVLGWEGSESNMLGAFIEMKLH